MLAPSESTSRNFVRGCSDGGVARLCCKKSSQANLVQCTLASYRLTLKSRTMLATRMAPKSRNFRYREYNILLAPDVVGRLMPVNSLNHGSNRRIHPSLHAYTPAMGPI